MCAQFERIIELASSVTLLLGITDLCLYVKISVSVFLQFSFKFLFLFHVAGASLIISYSVVVKSGEH